MAKKKHEPERRWIVELGCPNCKKATRTLLDGRLVYCPKCEYEYFKVRERNPVNCPLCNQKTQEIFAEQHTAWLCADCALFSISGLSENKAIQELAPHIASSGITQSMACSNCGMPLVEAQNEASGDRILACVRCGIPDFWFGTGNISMIPELVPENSLKFLLANIKKQLGCL